MVIFGDYSFTLAAARCSDCLSLTNKIGPIDETMWPANVICDGRIFHGNNEKYFQINHTLRNQILIIKSLRNSSPSLSHVDRSNAVVSHTGFLSSQPTTTGFGLAHGADLQYNGHDGGGAVRHARARQAKRYIEM